MLLPTDTLTVCNMQRGKTLGVVGYGDIGQAAARIARAFKMRVVAMRRRATLSEQETKDGILVGCSCCSLLTNFCGC